MPEPEKTHSTGLLRDLGQMRRSFLEALLVVATIAVLFALALSRLASRPGAALLQNIAQIGATLLIAYAVEASWIARAGSRRESEEHDRRLGVFTALGAAGLVGIVLALSLAERARSGHWIWLDELAFGWVCASLFFFGVLIVMQPWVAHEWSSVAADE